MKRLLRLLLLCLLAVGCRTKLVAPNVEPHSEADDLFINAAERQSSRRHATPRHAARDATLRADTDPCARQVTGNITEMRVLHPKTPYAVHLDATDDWG